MVYQKKKLLKPLQRHSSLRTEKDVRLRIDLLEVQSSSIAKMLAKAISTHNDTAFNEYAERLNSYRSRIEELLWVLGERTGQSILDLHVVSKNNDSMILKDVIEKLKAGDLNMKDLPLDTQEMVRKGAAEMKKLSKS